jgi:squalene synthase HpnC
MPVKWPAGVSGARTSATLRVGAVERTGGDAVVILKSDNPIMGVGHYENFPVASLLCPAGLRPPIRAIYHFARTADDIADEGDASAAQRLASLAQYREALHADFPGAAAAPWPQVFGPLHEQIRRHRLPVQLLDDLLDAFVQDVGNPVYRNRSELRDYCRRSAHPIGRLLLHLHGVQDQRSLHQSDSICAALQLINFWQDLHIDLPRGRCYLPVDDVSRHGLVFSDAAQWRDSAATRRLIAELLAWATGLMHDGAPLVFALPGRVGWELRLVVQGGLRIADKIVAMDHGTLAARPRLTASDLPLLLWRATTMRRRPG